MIRRTPVRFFTAALLGLMLIPTTGCLGPNPLFSVGQTAINATVMTFVSTFWTNIINGS